MAITRYRYAEIDIQAVHESKHNPRRHFDDGKLRELADNIGQVGILTPLLVRPDPDSTPQSPRYEIAAGHRRYRAAKLAQVSLLPCLVREMTDQEFMEVLNIENLQREGLHPLDEAKGYEMLMAAPYSMSVEQLAAKVGRSVKYIYDRVKLLGLIPPLQNLFWQDKFAPGHAILLARLSKADQLRCLGSENACYLNGGLFEAQHTLYRKDAPEDVDEYKVRSVVELNAWIDAHVRFDRTHVDPVLFPATAQAIEQVRQQQDLGDLDLKHVVVPITYEHFAAPDVKDARDRTLSVVSWKRADGKQGSTPCDHAVLGCVVFGPWRGETFEVCIEKKTCLIHWKDRIRAAKQSAKAPAAGKPSVPTKSTWELERERREARAQQWAPIAPKVQDDVREKIAALPIGTILSGYLGTALVKHVKDWNVTPQLLSELPAGRTAESFLKHLCWAFVAGDLKSCDRAQPHLKGLGMKPAALLKRYAPAVQTSAEAPATAESRDKKAKKKGQAA